MKKSAQKITFAIGVLLLIIFVVCKFTDIFGDGNKIETVSITSVEVVHPLSSSESETSIEEPEASVQETEPEIQYFFRNDKLLTQHYEKHGIEMGFASKEEYEAAASLVVTNPDSLHKIEKEDGDDVYYLEETNEFVVVSTDGYIRTYFCPDSGKKYFDKQ